MRSSDGGAPDFLIPVTGTVVASVEPQFPEITVHLGQVNLVDGQAAAIAFGTVALGDPAVVRTFNVTNDGAAALTLGVPQLPAGFILTEPLAALLEPGTSDTFTVSMPTSMVGSFNGQIIITSNDADENPFNFPITGAVQEDSPPPPVVTFLSVRGNDIPIADDDDTPSVIDATDFGSIRQGASVTHTFMLTNESAGKLTINSVVVPDGFKLLKKAPKSLSPGKSASLSVVLTGGKVGTSAGDLIITTGDGNAAPMNFRISGVVADTDNTQDIGPITKKGTATGLIGGGDASDTVTFSLAARSKVTLGLKGKKTDLDLFVLNNLGTLLGQSSNAGTKSEKLTLELEAGTYTLRIDSVDDSVAAWTASISSKAVN